jgi:hypothetical protein
MMQIKNSPNPCPDLVLRVFALTSKDLESGYFPLRNRQVIGSNPIVGSIISITYSVISHVIILVALGSRVLAKLPSSNHLPQHRRQNLRAKFNLGKVPPQIRRHTPS